VIYERRQKKNVKLDPRIYPSWWGEDETGDTPARGFHQKENVPVIQDVKN
jgi:hypothetical protein